jgi:small-conductance mechanosensitive channel
VETGTARAKKPSPKAVENLKHVDEVKEALEKVHAHPDPESEPSSIRARAWWLGGILLALACGLVASRVHGEYGSAKYWVERVCLALGTIMSVIVVEQALEVWTLHRVKDNASRFNLKRVLRLLAGMTLVAAVVMLLIDSWATAFASLGLASLILGFALQTPITSFIGWVYILTRKPYRVGDRIRIGEAQGDVIDVSYLDTTLWEFGGEFLSTDHPSGRVIKFPNSNVLNTPVYNYSWPLFPYIWSEIKLEVAYQSDLAFVSGVLREVAMERLGQAMIKRVATYRQLLAETPVDALTVNERPNVQFRTGNNTWIEVILRYLVEPKEAGRVKTAILEKALDRLNAEPERVMFPRSNLR